MITRLKQNEKAPNNTNEISTDNIPNMKFLKLYGKIDEDDDQELRYSI